MTQTLLLYTNALICGAIFLRLLSWNRRGARYRFGMSLLAYAMMVGSGSVALSIFFGLYEIPVEWTEVLLNGVLCAAVFAARGNVSCLFRPNLLRKGALPFPSGPGFRRATAGRRRR